MELTTSDLFKEPFRMSFTDTVYSNDTHVTLLYHSHMIYVVTHLKKASKKPLVIIFTYYLTKVGYDTIF